MLVRRILCDCFEWVDWPIFKESGAKLDEYAFAVTDFISKYVENSVPKKMIPMFPNMKPWKNCEVHSQLKSRSAAFKINDPGLYNKSFYAETLRLPRGNFRPSYSPMAMTWIPIDCERLACYNS